MHGNTSSMSNANKKNNDSEPMAKRPRNASKLKVHHRYAALDRNEEDDVSHNRNVQQINKIPQYARPKH